MKLIKRIKFVRFDFWVWILYIAKMQLYILHVWTECSFDGDGETTLRKRCQFDLKKKI
jgi:hypothetical protein